MSLDQYLSPINEKENTSFYLGQGIYDTEQLKWSMIKRDQPEQQNQIINFGGWGSCSEAKNNPNLCNSDFQQSDMSDCRKNIYTSTNVSFPPTGSSTGPNVVWTSKWIETLPDGQSILDKGYTGISIDIEGVGDKLDGFADKLKGYKQLKLDTILTIPGYGCKNATVGVDPMAWLTEEVKQYTDYICLMFYALINDSECAVGVGSDPDKFKSSLHNMWSGTDSTYKFDPSQLILGFSFGVDTSPQKYLVDNGIWPDIASGGITRWAEYGGVINWNPVPANSSIVKNNPYNVIKKSSQVKNSTSGGPSCTVNPGKEAWGAYCRGKTETVCKSGGAQKAYCTWK